jgi:hypothetical protein
MVDLRAINRCIEKQLAAAKLDGAPATEATHWLTEANLLDKNKSPFKHLRSLLATGKISGAYQFPNKRWVVVNRNRLPDGINRVIPIKEAAETLGISERAIRQYVATGELTPLNFGPSMLLFLEDELKRFDDETMDRSLNLVFPDDGKRVKPVDIDKLRRQLYYLRSDIRLIAERIEELIKLLE